MRMTSRHETVTIGITDPEDVLRATPEMEGKTMSEKTEGR